MPVCFGRSNVGLHAHGILFCFNNTKMITTIAIDPGASGGVAFHNAHDGIYTCFDLYPITDLLEAIDTLKEADSKIRIVVEDLPPYTGNKIPGSRSFKMGVSYGLILGIGAGAGIPTYKIKPKDWQNSLAGVKGTKGNDRKKILRDICKRLYPDLKPTLKTCDAILILHQYLLCKDIGK